MPRRLTSKDRAAAERLVPFLPHFEQYAGRPYGRFEAEPNKFGVHHYPSEFEHFRRALVGLDWLAGREGYDGDAGHAFLHLWQMGGHERMVSVFRFETIQNLFAFFDRGEYWTNGGYGFWADRVEDGSLAALLRRLQELLDQDRSFDHHD